MSGFISGNTALLIVDVQLGLFSSPAIPPVDRAEGLLAVLKELIDRARQAGVAVVYVQHCGPQQDILQKGKPGWEIHPALQPRAEDPVIQKRYCDSFLESGLHELLQSRSITSLVIAGIQTEFCIDTACRRAFSLGYHVTLVEDGHSTWDTPVLKASEIVAHHNLTLSSSFLKLTKADSLFQQPSLKVAANG